MNSEILFFTPIVKRYFLVGVLTIMYLQTVSARTEMIGDSRFGLHTMTVSANFQQVVSGKVIDENGQPLPGASIIEKGTSNGTQSDFDGNFSLSTSNLDVTLVVSYVGFASQEVAVGGRTRINVTLVESASGLDEVVVVGYGTQSKKKVTGSIGSVSAAEIEKIPVTSLDQALQGRIAGVQVTQNDGTPGGGVSIRIRGVGSINSNSEPLYIVDGVPLTDIKSINPSDIKRIDVLKDASAASIYGSRGSNGVVLITTKRAEAGILTVSLDAFGGIQTAAKRLDLLNGRDFARLANENFVNAGLIPNPAWSNPSTVLNTDWQDEVLRAAPMQSYNVAISGGNEKAKVYLSLGYFDQQGIIPGYDYNRYTGRLNADYQISNKLKVGMNVNGSFDKRNSPGGGPQFSPDWINGIAAMQPTSPNRTDFEGLFGLNPDGSIDPNGNSYFGWEGFAHNSKFVNPNYSFANSNPVWGFSNASIQPSALQSLLTSGFAEYEVIPGLKIKSMANLTFDNSFRNTHVILKPAEIRLFDSPSTYFEGWNRSIQKNFINTISYDKSFGDHTLNLVGGIDILESTIRFVDINTSDVPADQPVIDASDRQSRVVSGFPTDFGLVSYFGRIVYDYKDKYLLTASIRRDGSSRFGPDNQYGTFPSASVGWIISEEEFMQSQKFFQELKVRGSYGEIGNQNIVDFGYLSTYSNDNGSFSYVLGTNEDVITGAYANNIGDPGLSWEKSIQKNIGLETAFLNSFTLTVDYYTKELVDLLGRFPVPNYTGVLGGSLLRNGFAMENSGLELALGYYKKIGEVNFSANANFATLENRVTKIIDKERDFITQGGIRGDGFSRAKVGERLGTIYGYVTNGIAQNASEADVANSGMGGLFPGDRLYKDTNGDGIINGEDRVALGNGLPKATFGLSLNVDYKNIDFSVLFTGQSGVEAFNTNKFHLHTLRYFNSTGMVNGSTDLLNSWTGPGSTNELPRNSYDAPVSNKWFSDFYMEDASFVRMRNIQLGYTLEKELSKKLGTSKARLYVSGQNLLTFTQYTGLDPEIGSPNGNVLLTGVDNGRNPSPKTILIGINFQF